MMKTGTNFLDNILQFIKEYWLLFFVAIACYGIFVPWLGWYYDDWPFAWIAARFGAMEFFPAFLPFRPFLSPIFALTTSLIPASPIPWHIFNIFIRLSLSISAGWTLNQIFPAKKHYGFWISLFMLVFPSFGQQFMSLTHSNQELIPHIFQVLSFGMMASLSRKKFEWNRIFVFSIVFTGIGIFSTEYFLMLEGIRPLIIWIVLKQEIPDIPKRIIVSFSRWFPYLVVLLFNFLWLFLYYRSPYYESYSLSVFSSFQENPIIFFLESLRDFLQTFLIIGIKTWTETIDIIGRSLREFSTYLGLIVSAIVFCAAWIATKSSGFIKESISDKKNIRISDASFQAILVGCSLVLLGRVPSWAAGFPLSREFPYDRLIMPMMYGGSLFLIGMVDYFVRNRERQRIIFLVLLSFGAGQQFINSNTYRRSWDIQNNFFQQLQWRIPSMKSGTMLVTHETGIPYVTDNSLSAAINWLYDPDNSSRDMEYMLVYSKARLYSELLPNLYPDSQIQFGYRTLEFSGRVGDAIVFYFPSEGCLRILDNVISPEEVFPRAPYQLIDLIHISNLSRIQNERSTVTHPSFFKDPMALDDWCYFFQKAELARQYHDWLLVTDLYQQALEKNLIGKVKSEYLVFFEGYIRIHDYYNAEVIMKDYLSDGDAAIDGLCYTIKRIKINSNAPTSAFLNSVEVKYKCTP